MVIVNVGVDKFEVCVEDTAGVMLPHISHEGKHYCIARPGETFRVRVQRDRGHETDYRRPLASCRTPMECSMKVDGKCLGYYSKIHTKLYTLLDGFWVSHKELRKLTFAQPKFCVANETSEDSREEGVGVIEVNISSTEIYACPGGNCLQCEFLGFGGVIRPDIAMQEAAEVKSKEDKKFFTKPSLSVVGGDAFSINHLRPSFHYRTLVGGPSSILRIQCETAETLLLRKVLKLTNPEHASIVEKARDLIRSQNKDREEPDISQREKEVKPSAVHLQPTMVEGGVATPTQKNRSAAQRAKRKKTLSALEDFEDAVESPNGDSHSDCVIFSSKKSKMVHLLD